jgi:hypothetical protein
MQQRKLEATEAIMEEGTPSKSKIVSWVTNHNAERRIFMGFDLFVKRN